MTANNIYRDVNGIYLSWAFQEHIIKEVLEYKPKPGDVFVVSYPKCGTTWTQHIVYAIYNDGRSPKNMDEFMLRSPFMELVGAGAAEAMPRPGALKTHLPFSKQPYSPEAKYIYVSRNPYDCCVSYYYHCKSFPTYQFADHTFDEFFDMFVEGKVEYGDYFDHQISWYDHRNDDNVLFVTYEELKTEPRAGILKIADFLGDNYGRKLREEPEMIDRVLNACSIKKMRESNEEFRKWGSKTVEILATTGKSLSQDTQTLQALTEPISGEFVRKGIIGDWKNHFSQEQVKRMKERIALKTQNSTLMSLWKDVDLP